MNYFLSRFMSHPIFHIFLLANTPLSSAVRSIGWDGSTQTLVVLFDELYAYYHVPQGIWIGLSQAASKGEYIQQHIIGNYQFDRIICE